MLTTPPSLSRDAENASEEGVAALVAALASAGAKPADAVPEAGRGAAARAERGVEAVEDSGRVTKHLGRRVVLPDPREGSVDETGCAQDDHSAHLRTLHRHTMVFLPCRVLHLGRKRRQAHSTPYPGAAVHRGAARPHSCGGGKAADPRCMGWPQWWGA